MSTHTNETFETLLEKYNGCLSSIAANPHPTHKDGFNAARNDYDCTWKGKRDLVLMKLIMLKQQEISFLRVELVDGVYKAIYNPYQNYLNGMPSAEYTEYPAKLTKEKSLAKYELATNEKIQWNVKMLSCPVERLFEYKFRDWLSGAKSFLLDSKDLVKAAANLIKLNPHAEQISVGKYIETLRNWLQQYIEDIVTLSQVEDSILDTLSKSMLFKNEREDKSTEAIFELLLSKSLEPSWQDCSEKSNVLFKKIDFDVQKHTQSHFDFKKKVEAAKQARLAALNKNKQPTPAVAAVLKRQREEDEARDGEDDGQPPEKRARLD